YIIGYTDFINARISVTPDVLIPRIETEQLVEIIIANHSDKNLSVLDIGTGSGCIPIALKMERPNCEVFAFDISEKALSLAKVNARTNETDINFSNRDIIAPQTLAFGTQFEVIISTPPYTTPAEEELLEPQVSDYEPHEPLFFDDT